MEPGFFLPPLIFIEGSDCPIDSPPRKVNGTAASGQAIIVTKAITFRRNTRLTTELFSLLFIQRDLIQHILAHAGNFCSQGRGALERHFLEEQVKDRMASLLTASSALRRLSSPPPAPRTRRAARLLSPSTNARNSSSGSPLRVSKVLVSSRANKARALAAKYQFHISADIQGCGAAPRRRSRYAALPLRASETRTTPHCLGRQKTFENKPIRWQPRSRQCSNQCARPRNRHDIDTSGPRLANQVVTRIGNQRRTRVGDQRHIVTGQQARDKAATFFALVVLVTGG